jgi:hypothetical protein
MRPYGRQNGEYRHTKGFDFFGAFIDLVWDTSLVQEDAEEESSKTCSDNHHMRVLAIADRGRLGRVFDLDFVVERHNLSVKVDVMELVEQEVE